MYFLVGSSTPAIYTVMVLICFMKDNVVDKVGVARKRAYSV